MSNIDKSELTSWLSNLEMTVKNIPQAKGELHEKAAQLMKKHIDSEAPEVTGALKSWQEQVVGSYKGYAKIRPKSGKLSPNSKGKAYALGQITNAVKSGHRIRPPGAGKRYKQKIEVGRVAGNDFYGRAFVKTEADLIQLTDSFLDQLANGLSGE